VSHQFSDLDGLPDSPLTMSAMVGLPSSRLRRLLKAGLKRGLKHEDLSLLLEQDWGLAWESADALSLLDQLADKGWMTYQPEQQVWKTRLGNRSNA
jgi:hypothetical protein